MYSPVLPQLEIPPAPDKKPERSLKLVTSKDPAFFSTVLLEVDDTERVWRTWSAILSFSFQLLAVAALTVVPLMFPGTITTGYIVTSLLAPPLPPPPPAPRAPAAKTAKIAREIVSGQLVAPLRVPSKIKIVHEDQTPEAPDGVIGGVIGGVPGGLPGGVIGGILGSVTIRKVVAEPPPIQQPQRVRVSEGVTLGLLLTMTQPVYPPAARTARVEGDVLLKAVIGRDGSIAELQIVSGSPFLASAAIQAVKQWRYKPYLLNGLPTEAETFVTVRFRLNG